MQDRFKFRVWNKENKKLYDWDFLEKTKGENTFFWVMHQAQNDCKYNILMQCTGLKDKNGKLIYEGDVVNKGTRCKWIIIWFKNRFILVPDFEYKNKDKCASDRECGFKYFENNHSYADKDDEVIGNIYEDSHLIENSNNLC